MQCTSCAAALPSGASRCPRCGMPTPYTIPASTAYDNDAVPYIDFGSFPGSAESSFANQPPEPGQPHPETPFIDFGPGSRPALPPEASSTGYGPAYRPPYPNQQPMPYPDWQHPSFYANAQPQPQPQFLPAQPQLPRQRLSTGMTVAIILLALAVIIGGLLITYAAASRSTAQSGQPKPAAAKPTVTINASDPQTLYTQVVSTTPILNDPLTAQGTTTWDSPVGGCAFTSGALHLSGSASSSGQSSLCLAESTNYSDFAFQIKMTIQHGDVGGLLFRFDTTDRKLYFFALGPQGEYALVSTSASSSSSNGSQVLASGTAPTAINETAGQANLLTIIARGNTIYLYANKQYLTSTSDTTSSTGEIGVVGGNSAGGTFDVAFNNAQVWKL